MGLAASQARLLTITSRKLDCEYASMALSHEKMALARDMNIVSAEYQDSLSQTKLVYDFYGTGDTSTDLTYGLLMTPSEINNYMPTPITDQSGRLVLDTKLATAARAAGIPQEGLGCTPSSDVRDTFINALIDTKLITRTVGENVKEIQYNPTMGIGTVDIVNTTTELVGFEDFVNNVLANTKIDFGPLTMNAGGSELNFNNFADNQGEFYYEDDGSKGGTRDTANVSIKDLINGNYVLYGVTWTRDQLRNDPSLGGLPCIIDKVASSSLWDILFESLGENIDPNDANTVAALEYAKQQTLERVVSLTTLPAYQNAEMDLSNAVATMKGGDSSWSYKWANSATGGGWTNPLNIGKSFVGLIGQGLKLFGIGSSKTSNSDLRKLAKQGIQDAVGYVYVRNKVGDGNACDGYGINISNMVKAFYTFFAQYKQGIGSSNLVVDHLAETSNFVTDFPNSAKFSFNVVSDVDTTGNNMLVSGFYDALFNQIATKGWVENEQVKDKDYMQKMLKNGCMFISSIADDNYYYMANYATNTYIKEITDEEGIALAEAKYQREKAKISAKENTVDMKMKNLDTEISALTVEYDTVKSVIQQGVKTSFTRYEA